MKFWILVGLVVVSTSLVAGGDKWQENRNNRITQVDRKIAALQEFKSCLQRANARSEFVACKERHQAKMQSPDSGGQCTSMILSV